MREIVREVVELRDTLDAARVPGTDADRWSDAEVTAFPFAPR